MKLLIILLCLASERYLIHMAADYRLRFFSEYFERLFQFLPASLKEKSNAYLLLAMAVIPIVLLTWIIFAIFGNILYGLIGFILSFIIFYFCLGPENSFYPLSASGGDEMDKEEASAHYFVAVNNQLFAVIFWFIILGPLAVLAYRIISFCTQKEMTKPAAIAVLDVVDWITARLTTLLYLMVGNFQKGLHAFVKMFFSSPENNAELLKKGGMLAAEINEGEVVSLPHAQVLVEHALVVYLVFLAFFTLAAWL